MMHGPIHINDVIIGRLLHFVFKNVIHRPVGNSNTGLICQSEFCVLFGCKEAPVGSLARGDNLLSL